MRLARLRVPSEACLRKTGLGGLYVLAQERPQNAPRINRLVEDVRRDPFTGIGKPEPLKYHLPGVWSRRIDDEQRLVYLVTDKEVVILAARYQY